MSKFYHRKDVSSVRMPVEGAVRTRSLERTPAGRIALNDHHSLFDGGLRGMRLERVLRDFALIVLHFFTAKE
jgi:hypothetical protein